MSTSRLGIVVSHPIQYQAPLYRYLQEHTDVHPHVLFLTDHGVGPSYDPGFGREIRYDVPLLDGYDHEFVANRSPRPSPSTPFGAIDPALPAAIRRAHLDAVLVHGYSNLSHWLAYATATALRLPYLLRGESRPDPAAPPAPKIAVKRAVKRAVLQPLVRGAAACLAIGADNRAYYLAYGARPEQIFPAPYSVDNARFAASGAEGRTQRGRLLGELGLDPCRPTVLFAAKLQPWKRPLDVVDAVDRLDGAASLIVIGDGPLRPALEARRAARPWMRTLGFVNQSEIARWYGATDLFVLPSEHEPWGLAVNEAMAAGAVPIVSDAVGCAPDLVAPGAGWVYPVGDVAALAAALAEAIRPGALDQRGPVAGRLVGDHGIDRTAEGIAGALRVVLGR